MSKLTRRSFVQSVGALGLTLPAVMPALSRAASPNGMVNHASIGVGGMGWGDLNNFAQHKQVNIAAVCDVDTARLDKAAKFKPQARTYIDWRELLAKEGDKIDSVNVTVPDHMHCAIAMIAIRAKKNVYCQKPMCHDVAEVRALTRAAVQAGVVTQLGTQHASGIGDRMAVQFMREKAVGKIKRLVLCSNRPGAVENYRLEGPRPTQPEEPPKELNWDLWLGTAPVRPYASKIYHPTKWRAWQDFGTGWSGDIGCHIFDAPWKGLKLTTPKTVTAEVQESWKNSPARRGDTWPQGDHITWVFPGNEYTDGDLIVEWFDGAFFPPDDVQKMAEIEHYPAESAMIIGTDGAILLPHTGGPQLLPRAKYKDVQRPQLPPRNHYHHFVDAILGKEKNESHFAQTGPMTEAILLGTVAIRQPGTVLQWDSANMKFPNAPEAEKFLRRTYRAGWEVAGVV
jgi:predicted dehydrogenase